jgi:hypothetical protein
MENLLSVLVGVGLAAACGFRVFVPLLVLSLAARSGEMTLGHGFGWIASQPALIAFAVATLVEIAGYYIPWVDHLLDTVATPTAVVAGVLVTASTLGHMSPFLQWSVALLAGGGTAAVFQGLTAAARGVSTLTTGGLGNPIVSTVEAGGSALLSVLAVTVPVLAVLSLFLLLYFGVKRLLLRRPAARTT